MRPPNPMQGFAPAEEGLNSLTLSNAMLLSGLKCHPIDIPFDDHEYADLLAELAGNSKFEKRVRRVENVDITESFH